MAALCLHAKDTFLLPRHHDSRIVANLALLAASMLGIVAFAFPFLVSAMPSARGASGTRSVEASLLLGAIVAGVLIIAIGELVRGSQAGSVSRSVALLGALVAVDAALRLAPTFLGASPLFALIVLVGYVYGPRFGFVMGALTLLLSAAITAGVGPWLPFQMLCAGWTGMAAGGIPHSRFPWPVMVYAALAGFGYGALMNLYAWPFAAPGATTDAGLFWTPDLSLTESVARYATFYLATSAVYDAFRALANVALILLIGAPVVRLLQRFKMRTSWTEAVGSEPPDFPVVTDQSQLAPRS